MIPCGVVVVISAALLGVGLLRFAPPRVLMREPIEPPADNHLHEADDRECDHLEEGEPARRDASVAGDEQVLTEVGAVQVVVARLRAWRSSRCW